MNRAKRTVLRGAARWLGLLAAATAAGCIGVSAPPPKHGGAHIKKCADAPFPAETGMIDDFEDENTAVMNHHGRSGYWFKSADAGGSFFGPDDLGPIEGDPVGRPGSFIIHAIGQTGTGDPETVWGAQLGATLNSGGGTYDGSQYVGISFWAKSAEGKSSSVRFEVADANTHPDGGICTTCWNHFGTTLSLTTEWKQYVIPFRQLSQEEGWGDPRPPNVDPSRLVAVNWKIKPGNTFEFWLDDVQFLDCE
jgi:hypothetical protein